MACVMAAPQSLSAQEEEYVIMPVLHLVDMWRGDLWQKGGQYRCTTRRHVYWNGKARPDIDKSACEQMIECYRTRSPATATGDINASTKWTRINKEGALSLVMGECIRTRSSN
jgi:hypothetical protein